MNQVIPQTPVLKVERYGNRHWSVLIDNELLAVVVSRKGARNIVDTIERLLAAHD